MKTPKLLLAACAAFTFFISHAGTGKPAVSGGIPEQGLSFVKNLGQWGDRCLYRVNLTSHNFLFLESDRFTYVLFDGRQIAAAHARMHDDGAKAAEDKINGHAFQFIFRNARKDVEIQPAGIRQFYHNYYLGNDPSRWASRVPVYSGLMYDELYPGIDLQMREDDGGLKYDYILEPGADISQIIIDIEGAEEVDLKDGNLLITTSAGQVMESIPLSYQDINGAKVPVSCRFYQRVDGGIGITGKYDSRYRLIIDPVVMSSTYSGGTASSYGHCATYDGLGNIYGGARCFGAGYPATTGAFQTTFGGQTDIAISKLDPNGVNLLFATYLGGSAADLPHSMFVDASYNFFVFGTSFSTNYPVSTGAYDVTSNGQSDIVITKLNSTGTTLLGSTFIGGNSDDGRVGNVINYSDDFRGEIVVDANGDPFIASATESSDFPTTSGAYNVSFNGQTDAIVFKMNANLTSLLWSTFIGTSGTESAMSLRLDGNGNVIFTGTTDNSAFPTTNGALNPTYLGGQEDGFVARLDATGSTLLQSTFVGSSQRDLSFFVDLDASGNVHVFGNTLGTMPITTGVYGVPNSQNFLMKLSPSLNNIIWSTTLGDGTHGSFAPSALMVDVCENVYLCGWGQAGNYPLTSNAVQTNTISSGFHIMVLDGSGTTLIYGGPFGAGGEHVDGGTSRFDPSGVVYQSVCACGASFPTLSNNYSPTKKSSGCDMALFKIDFETNCTGFSTTTVICAGSVASFSIVNFSNLANPSYSVQPGNMSLSGPVFTVSPSTSTTYTVYITGTNTNNAVVTRTGQAIVIVNPQVYATPNVTQASCTSTANALTLSLSFVPSLSTTPSYTLLWNPVPNGITNDTMLASPGPITPGVYNVTVMLASGCNAEATFTVNPIPPQVTVTLNEPPLIDCRNPKLTLSLNPSNFTYTWSAVGALQTGNTATFVGSGPLNWTVTGYDPVWGCTSTMTFAIIQSTSNVTSVLSPTFQNITCTLSSIATISATASPTVNIQHYWLSPNGGSVVTTGHISSYLPGGPGTYTHIAVNEADGCKITTTVDVVSNEGFPTFTLTSPQNFTVGCSSKSVATVNMQNAQTTPTAGGAVSYTMLPPGHTGPYGTNTVSTYTNLTVPGTYTFIVKAGNNGCETKVPASILQNTVAPDVQAIVPSQVVTCFQPNILLAGASDAPAAEITWLLPGGGNLSSDTVRVFSNGPNTATVIGNYTLQVVDQNNACVSRTVIPMLQNIIPPDAAISGATEISCKTSSVVLSNNSKSRIPPYFNPSNLVTAALWTGPSPQVPKQFSSTYPAYEPGTYTLLARDMSNGCEATTTFSLADNRIYPLVNIPSRPGPFILDCGMGGVQIYPNVIGTLNQFAYEWESDEILSSTTDPTITVFNIGRYGVTVTNTVNGCSASGNVEVRRGNLTASVVAQQNTIFAPSIATFTNLSSSSSPLTGTESITTVWSFGNGTVLTTPEASVNPQALYTQPGTYTVIMYATKGNCIDTAYLVLHVEMPSKLNIPNIFTPNGDGVNDVFFLHAAQLKEINAVIINRWGEVYYEVHSTTGNIEWDGKTQRGDPAPDGEYLLILRAKGVDGKEYESRSAISLMR